VAREIGRWFNLILLVILACALVATYARLWPRYEKSFQDGLKSRSSAVTLPEERKPFVDPVGGVLVTIPASYTVALSSRGVVVQRSEEPYGCVVTPIRLLAALTLPELLERISKEWEGGLVQLGGRATLGTVHDEGAVARASLDLEMGGDKLAGEARVIQSGADVRLEVYWCPKEDFDRERAALDQLPKVVSFSRPQALPLCIGKRFACALPEPYEMREESNGLEVAAKPCPRVAFGLTTGEVRDGLELPDQIIDAYVAHSRELTTPTSGACRVYPRFVDEVGRSWDITAREMSYELSGEPVRAVLTAGIATQGPSRRFVLAVRQAPQGEWDRRATVLAAVEASARILSQSGTAPPLKLPLVHPDGAGELVEAWQFEQRSRFNAARPYVATLLAYQETVADATGRRMMTPLTDAQPDGTFLDPTRPMTLLGRPVK
jgi:hypothetical protein